ncbi:type II toxin-antitoxin system RelE/ParE family toxin [Cognatiyoonia sp. IB215182]|uniref:type II toxin-antitoxin system RelE/ParE family toxin n=1 Tax=Cognatiyoonia sp. IB215182 TaxID=3097353 RepID=UPI002A0DF46F|nr:type II toxin-antitoxin system RelE/ParE family toxin [Cognatiyoonia sp. IB215182]MDX8355780.1 type II toxin-antitoxin system RelE/ParE family toxin [Cognatiyoonia sp. IB215182]
MVEIAADAEQDLSLIFDHLFATYVNLGEPDETAFVHAAARVRSIQESVGMLASNPFRGTMRESYGPDVRNITIDRAVIWFELDGQKETVRVLAYFFGGQDHTRHMLRRLLER